MKKRTKKFQLGGMALNDEPVQVQGATPNYWYNQSVPDVNQDNQNLRTNMQNLGIIGMKKGGKVSSASKRGDGCVQRGKTRGKMV